MKTGDIIEFSSPDLPLPCVQAVVIEEAPEHVEVMSTLLAPFRHPGVFPRDHIRVAGVVCEAAEAVPRETGFALGERVTCVHGEGVAVAGFDGILVTRRDDGELITGGAAHFMRLPPHPGREEEAEKDEH